MKKKLLTFTMIAGMSTLGLTACGNSVDAEKVIGELEEFTTLGEDGDSYLFCSDDNWILTYTTGNSFVRFSDDTVYDCFNYLFGADGFSEEWVGEFGYDLDENEARMYFDTELKDEGELTIISYDLDDEEFYMMVDGEHCKASDEFAELLEDFEIDTSIKENVENFKETLKENGVGFEDVAEMEYEDIAEIVE